VVLFNDATSNKHELSQDILVINIVFINRMQGKELFYIDENVKLSEISVKRTI
jgi:hypothetical protein